MKWLLRVALLMGMGYLIAITPSIWTAIVYLIPILSIALFIRIAIHLFKSED